MASKARVSAHDGAKRRLEVLKPDGFRGTSKAESVRKLARYHDNAQRIDLVTLDKLCPARVMQVGELFEYIPDERAR